LFFAWTSKANLFIQCWYYLEIDLRNGIVVRDIYSSHIMLRETFFTTITTHRQFIVLMVALGFLCWFVVRWWARKLFVWSVRGTKQNIQTYGRLLRGISWVLLLLVALVTDMNPWLLFFAWFCFFQAWFSRCGFYAAIGKSSCPAG